LAYEVGLRDKAREFVCRIRREKALADGNFLLLRKREDERRLQEELL
jgi:hypothetical protein